MTKRIVLLLALVGCGGGGSTDAKTAHDEHVDYVDCLKKDWYPGVTDKKAPRVNVIVTYQDQTASYTPKDYCMSIDGRPLLSTVDRAAIIPRLEKREPMTWKGTVSPGKHELGAHLRSVLESKDGVRTDQMAHDVHSFEAAEGMTLVITATSPDGKLTLTTK